MSGRGSLRHRRWSLLGIGVSTVVAGILTLPAAAEERERGSGVVVTPESLENLEGVVSGELTDVARALRSLDQSYTYRGMRGCGSATAGSVYIDWDAKGVPEEKRYRVLPPQPLVLSRSNKECGVRKQPCVEPAPAPVDPAPAQPCPCGAKQPDCPCQTANQPDCDCQTAKPACPCGASEASQPCNHVRQDCGCSPVTRAVTPYPAPSAISEEYRHQPVDFPAPIYRHGAASYGAGSYGCGGKTPPGAVLLNGRWTESSSAYGTGFSASGYYQGGACSESYGARVW
ncbi:MAG: hypothetical protein KDA75_16365 [Planctomycetaceae bacterium]|nr:hypothetical protein [Planctomycetaceae bacterium]